MHSVSQKNIDQKTVVVNEIKDKLSKATSVTLVDSRGLTVLQDTNLRKKLRDASIDYKVYKNTMIQFAIKGTEFESLSPYLEGPTAVAISYEDPTLAARLISGEQKTIPVLEFKAGVYDKVLYDAKGVLAISQIPPKNELLSKLLGSLKSPIAAFARTVNAIAEKQGNE